MKRTNIPIYIDLLFCLVIMPPIIMLVPVDRWIVHHTVFMLTLIVYLYGLYFVYRKARLPRLFMQRKFGHILLLMGILVVITLLLTQFPYPPEPNKLDPLIHKARQHLRSQTVWFFFLVVTGFSLSIELIFELFRQILSKQEIEAEKNRAELALYKAQINPHFLFNTLNMIACMAKLEDAATTERMIASMSNLFRYNLKTSEQIVPLERELKVVSDYMYLQQMRFGKRLRFTSDCPADTLDHLVPSFALQPLVENAIVHGISAQKEGGKIHRKMGNIRQRNLY